MDSIVANFTGNKYHNEIALLDIESHATKHDVRNAYRRKACKMHPDAGGNEDDFKRLYIAYRTLLKVMHD